MVKLREIARRKAQGVPLDEIGAFYELSPEALARLMSSDAFQALEREEVIRNLGGPDG